jgi:membrane associated rhomboid family serine protease
MQPTTVTLPGAMSMPPPAPVMCYRHPDRATGRSCTRCGRPACAECLVQASVGSQCVDCVRQGLPRGREQLRRWAAGKPMLMTKVFIGLSVAMFLFELTSGAGGILSTSTNRVERDYGLVSAFVANGEWWRIFTSGFVHFGLLHLALNMLVIYQVSLMLEPPLGALRYTLIYLCCLVAGSAGALLLTDNPFAVTAGASGAAFGLVGCAIAGMVLRKMPVLRSNLGGLLIINLVITFAIPGISIGGHIGGLVAGFLCGLVLLKPRRGPAPAWDILVPVVLGGAGFVLALWAASPSPVHL